jgi:hypothetical protein
MTTSIFAQLRKTGSSHLVNAVTGKVILIRWEGVSLFPRLQPNPDLDDAITRPELAQMITYS